MGDGQERTEQATLKHRLDARKKGTVARSIDLTNAVTIVALLLVLPFAAAAMGSGLLGTMRASTTNIPDGVSVGQILGYGSNALRPVLPGLCMIMGTVLVMGVAASFAQVGFTFSPQALTPNFSKINPLRGIQRFFSATLAFEAAKALGKTILFGLIAYSTIRGDWYRLAALNHLLPMSALSVVGGMLRTLAFRIALAWGALAGLDYYFQRKQIDKQLRMTKEEVKREMREAELSPEVKAARAQRRRKLMRRRLREAVRSADVIVTNPTHFAVALKYEPKKNHAPMVVAKGVDFLAAKIREEASAARVPLIENPPLARALYAQCEIGDFVPRELFQAVAEVLAHVYRTLKKMPK